MILRLDPPIWLYTPVGQATAHFMIAETGMDIAWVCCVHGGSNNGECRTFQNKDIRFQSNETIGLIVSNPWVATGSYKEKA